MTSISTGLSSISESGLLVKIKLFFASKVAKVGAGMILGILCLVILGTFLIPYSPNAISVDRYSPPTLAHPFGTDYLGHDVLSQAVWGAYPSLITALISALAATVIGFLAGVYSGYFTKIEPIIGGATDVVMSFPGLPLLIIIGTIFLFNDQLILIALIIVMWAPVSRAVRSQTLAIKKFPYVEAGKTAGMNDRQIIWRIIVYKVVPIAVAYFIINIALGIILITALEFLGVGNPLVVSWGSMLYWARTYAFDAGAWWWILAPGALITLTTTGFALIGYSFEEMVNPRLRK